MKTMYKGMINSPGTVTMGAISPTDTAVTILSPAAIPELPNLMTFGQGDEAETVLVKSRNGSSLQLQRGFQGTAKSWPTGTIISRNFTDYDQQTFIDNILEAFEMLSRKVDNTLITAANDLIFGASKGVPVKKTLAEAKAILGINNVTNESKSTMFTNPTLTGTPTVPTAAAGTNTTQAASTAFVHALGNLKLDKESYTAADVLSKIKTVDGIGSGLDADLLGGLNETYFARGRGYAADANDCVTPGGWLILATGANTPTTRSWCTYEVTAGGTGSITQTATTADGLNQYVRHFDGATWHPWRQVVLDAPSITTITTGFPSGWSGQIIIIQQADKWTEVYVDATKNADIGVSETVIQTLSAIFRHSKGFEMAEYKLLTAVATFVSNHTATLYLNSAGQLVIWNPTAATNARRLIGSIGYYAK